LKCLRGRDHSEDLGVDGRIILKWILGKYNWRVWFGFIWLKTKTGGGFLWNTVMNPPIKDAEFLELLTVLLASQEKLMELVTSFVP
jgi:hypothetical protein